jgi:hypothetical protein
MARVRIYYRTESIRVGTPEGTAAPRYTFEELPGPTSGDDAGVLGHVEVGETTSFEVEIPDDAAMYFEGDGYVEDSFGNRLSALEVVMKADRNDPGYRRIDAESPRVDPW